METVGRRMRAETGRAVHEQKDCVLSHVCSGSHILKLRRVCVAGKAQLVHESLA